MRPLLVAVGLALGSSTLPAQPASARPVVVLGGGIAGQYDGGRDVGSPGLSAAIGVEWPAHATIGMRIEAQGFEYGSQALAHAVGVRGSAERLRALSAVAVWTPRRGSPGYLLGGGAVARAEVTGASSAVVTGAGVLGVGARMVRWAGVEVQYLHATRSMGRTRSALAARVLLRL